MACDFAQKCGNFDYNLLYTLLSYPISIFFMNIKQTLIAVWISGNVVGHINKVAIRQAWLVLGWVTVSVFISQRENIYFGSQQVN